MSYPPSPNQVLFLLQYFVTSIYSQETIIEPLKQGEESHSFVMLRTASALGKPQRAWPPPPSKGLWRGFRFTKSKIVALKTQAGELCDPESDVGSPFLHFKD